jgi:uncharacterized protein YaaN involved in tellurite resistance
MLEEMQVMMQMDNFHNNEENLYKKISKRINQTIQMISTNYFVDILLRTSFVQTKVHDFDQQND